jgi:hypothetical protein
MVSKSENALPSNDTLLKAAVPIPLEAAVSRSDNVMPKPAPASEKPSTVGPSDPVQLTVASLMETEKDPELSNLTVSFVAKYKTSEDVAV